VVVPSTHLQIEALRRPHESTLAARVGVVDQLAGLHGVTVAVALPQRDPQRGEHQLGAFVGGRVPGHDPLGVHVEDERDVDEPGPGPGVDIPRESGVKRRLR